MAGKRILNDWLTAYITFVKRHETPMQYNLWCGISAIASCLQRKCYTNWGLLGYTYPNFYIALVGPPGGRKGTGIKSIKEMLQDLDIPMSSDSLGSTQILYEEIKGAKQEYKERNGKLISHRSLNVWSEEFAVFLADQDPRFITSITDLFDSPRRWKYSALIRQTDLSNCWLNIIGAITPQLLQSKLTTEALGGGLVSRIIFVVGYGAEKLVALPFLTKEEEELKKQLKHDLEQIKLLAGVFKQSKKFLKTYEYWYENESKYQGIDNNKFLGYNARRALHLKKLCIIIAASESSDQIITEEHFFKSLKILEYTEREMPNAFYGLGQGAHAEVYTNILDFIEDKKVFSLTELAKKFQHALLLDDLKKYIQMMEQTGKIKKATNGKDQSVFYEVIEILKKDKPKSKYLNKTLFKGITQ
jgi:hypothetical protein